MAMALKMQLTFVMLAVTKFERFNHNAIHWVSRLLTTVCFLCAIGVVSVNMAQASEIDIAKIVIGPELVFVNKATDTAWQQRQKKSRWQKSLTLGVSRLFVSPISAQMPTQEGEYAQAKLLAKAILENCQGCQMTAEWDKRKITTYRILFPNDYWIVIGADPGVVEIQTKPLPFIEYIKMAPFIQSQIYDVAKRRLGLIPPITTTDGHTNIGVDSVFKNAKDLAAFILDQVSHPELALGVLGHDLGNAPPLSALLKDQQEQFYIIMEDVMSGSIHDIHTLTHQLLKNVYYQTTVSNPYHEYSGDHYQAVSVKRLRKLFPGIHDVPIELRYTAARKDFKTVLLNYELQLKRIQFVLNRKQQLSRDLVRRIKKVNASDIAMSASEKLSRFYIFVTEMGASFDRYRPLIFDPAISEARLDAFVTGEVNFNDASSVQEVYRYLGDVATSELVRKKMLELYKSPMAPKEFKEHIQLTLNQLLSKKIPEKILSCQRIYNH